MDRRRIQRLSCALLAAATTLIVVGIVTPAAANHRKDIKGSFTTTAFPSAGWSYWTWPAYYSSCGLRDVNYGYYTFEAPAKGTLAAETEFTGDWDLEITDERGNWLGGSYSGTETRERASVLLLKGDVVEIRACNYLGEPQVEVGYRFKFSR